MPEEKPQTNFGKPGALAVTRYQAGNDLVSAMLLYRIKFYFRPGVKFKKLTRFGKDWIAMSRSDWAREAGLSEGEMKNRALPRLRKLPFIEIRQMKLTPSGPKLLWVSLDLSILAEWTDDFEHSQWRLNGGTGPGYEKPPQSYPYKWDK
jgi:hypothetical protein